MSATKDTLRQQLRTMREALPDVARDTASLVIGRRLVAWLMVYAPQRGRVALFFAIRNEPDILSVASELRAQGYIVCLPRVISATEMIFTEWDESAPLVKDRQGILSAEGTPCAPDIICVPLLGFDRRGQRIGYGAGHYDRWMAQKHHHTAVGIAFAAQEVPEVPNEAHDQPLDWVVTEKEVILCQK